MRDAGHRRRCLQLCREIAEPSSRRRGAHQRIGKTSTTERCMIGVAVHGLFRDFVSVGLQSRPKQPALAFTVTARRSTGCAATRRIGGLAASPRSCDRVAAIVSGQAWITTTASSPQLSRDSPLQACWTHCTISVLFHAGDRVGLFVRLQLRHQLRLAWPCGRVDPRMGAPRTRPSTGDFVAKSLDQIAGNST